MMTCCPIGPAIDAANLFAGDLEPWVTTRPDGYRELDLIIPGICLPESISIIEDALERLPGLASARVNFTSKRVVATWNEPSFKPADITEKLNELGFISRPIDPSHSGLKADDAQSRLLLRAVAVSGFAAANIMLLSVSVWSGAEGSTRDLFHWISAGIALPTVAYAGRPFFRSAIRALSSGLFNMDVPISLVPEITTPSAARRSPAATSIFIAGWSAVAARIRRVPSASSIMALEAASERSWDTAERARARMRWSR